MTPELSKVLAAIAARHQAGYARVEDPASDVASLTTVIRHRRVVRHGTTTIVGAAATAALAFGAVQGWDAFNTPPAVSPSLPSVSETTDGTPSASPTPTPSESSSVSGALPALEGWTDAGADPAVFGAVTISDSVAVGGRVVVVGCQRDAVVAAAAVGFPAWAGDDAATWQRASGPAATDNNQPVNCLDQIVSTPYGYFAHGLDLFHSTDGLTWEQVGYDPQASSSNSGTVEAMFAVGDRLTVLVTRASMAESTVASLYTTTDGTTWTAAPADSAALFDNAGVADVIATAKGLVAVGASPGGAFVPTAAVWVSADGLTWQRVTPSSSDFTEASMTAVTATSDGFVAVGGNPFASGLMAVWSSGDGTAWQRVASPPETLDPSVAYLSATAVTSLGDTFFAAGEDHDAARPEQDQSRPALWRSVGGAAWERISSAALPGAVPFHVTQLGGTAVGLWPPTGLPGTDAVQVLTAAR